MMRRFEVTVRGEFAGDGVEWADGRACFREPGSFLAMTYATVDEVRKTFADSNYTLIWLDPDSAKIAEWVERNSNGDCGRVANEMLGFLSAFQSQKRVTAQAGGAQVANAHLGAGKLPSERAAEIFANVLGCEAGPDARSVLIRQPAALAILRVLDERLGRG